jgi:hypothetical protein
MTVPDEDWFRQAAARIVRLMALLTTIGTLTAFIFRGWTWAAGFGAGAAISWLNFSWLKRLTEALGEKRLRRGSAVFLGSRYLLLGVLAYVILRYSSISLPAVLTGLFVSVAAVIVEILFELVYGRNLDH